MRKKEKKRRLLHWYHKGIITKICVNSPLPPSCRKAVEKLWKSCGKAVEKYACCEHRTSMLFLARFCRVRVKALL
jgi:hypothetical protein